MQSKLLSTILFTLLTIHFSIAQTTFTTETNDVIKKHGLEKSQVIEIASWLTDVHGPRLTGSPGLDQATEWAVKQLKEWNMENVHLHEWGPFGRGWDLKHFEIHASSPKYFPIIGYPRAWSPSTKGMVEGEVVYLEIDEEADLDKYRGTLKGKFVFIDTLRVIEEWMKPPAKRRDAEALLNLANAPMPTPRGRGSRRGSGQNLTSKLYAMLLDEKPACIVDRSYKGDLGTVFVSRARTHEGSPYDEDVKVIPQVTMSVEHYNQIFRMMKKGMTPKLKMELKSTYTNPDGMEHNIIAEIPGTDLADQVVMFGAHFDSWHTGTGATDNGAGSSVMMEVARIIQETIKETGIKPRRTLRLALWTGEEQGLLGSRGYVGDQFAVVKGRFNVQSLKPAQEKVSAYYNLDNGTGKIRGIYLQGNNDAGPIFREWLRPFKDLDARTVTLSNTGGTDHLSFDAVGIPGFQFIQDPIAYSTRTHHSNMDNLDHLVEDDLKQAATIIASFVLQTAQRDEMIPRKKTDLKVER